MKYQNLHDLIDNSSSSRTFFLNLPVDIQLRLHEYGKYIFSAEGLHKAARDISQIKHLESLTMR